MTCSECDDSGFVPSAVPGGRQRSKVCVCQIKAKTAAVLSRAKIPKRYDCCTLDSFNIQWSGVNRTLVAARASLIKFTECYHPLENRGVLLTGSIGCGKTHLAVGALKNLIELRAAQGLFCDYRELLLSIQTSYNSKVVSTETEILAPVIETQVLLLDDLGAIRPSEWVWDTVSLVLNARYNAVRTTIITTNYPVLPAGTSTTKAETLGDRIGNRMLSRLLEMCRVVELQGEDYRAKIGRVNYSSYPESVFA